MPLIDFAHRTDTGTGSELVNCYAQATHGEKEEAPYVIQNCAGSDRVNSLALVRLQAFGASVYGIASDGSVYKDVQTASPHRVASVSAMGDDWWAIATRNHLGFGKVGGPPFALDNTDNLRSVQLTDPVGSATVVADSAVYAIHNSDRFWVSHPSDITRIDNTSFATAEVRADVIRRAVTVGETVVFLGADSTERWYVSGGREFPLDRYANAVSETGLAHHKAVCHIPDALVWVSRDLQVMLGLGQSAKPISTRTIHEHLEKYSTETFQGSLASYSLFGRWFVVLQTGQKTFEYDVTEGLWHTRQSPGGAKWLADQFITFDRKVYWPSPNGVMAMNDTHAKEDGSAMLVALQSGQTGTFESRSDVLDYIMLNTYDHAQAFNATLTLNGDRATIVRDISVSPFQRNILRNFGAHRRFTLSLTASPSERVLFRSVFAQMRRGAAG